MPIDSSYFYDLQVKSDNLNFYRYFIMMRLEKNQNFMMLQKKTKKLQINK